jgi:hypothetical protein
LNKGKKGWSCCALAFLELQACEARGPLPGTETYYRRSHRLHGQLQVAHEVGSLDRQVSMLRIAASLIKATVMVPDTLTDGLLRVPQAS